jgi:tripartite-type tricarboxylate transporter receptor subunit TctC
MAKLGRIVVGMLLACYAFTAQAQNYPNRPVKLIVSIAAGSVTDVIMRKAAAELAPKVGQQFIIENRGGASGIVAGPACGPAPPGG